jgi:phosphatidylglycerol:prolipoprotein diacylglycerol transferase
MTSTQQYWVHDLSPFLIEFPSNPLGLDGLRYYGLAYLIGFLGAWALLRVYDRRGKFAINAEDRATLMTAIIVGVLAGGRIGYLLLYDFAAFIENPLLLIRVDQGGMASHGGLFGVFLALVWFARRQKCRFLELGDIAVTLAPIGILFGRIANFINGELWGKATTVRWAVIFPDSPKVYYHSIGQWLPEPRHPSQLYAAGLEGLLLLAYAQWRFWYKRPPIGQLGGEFLIAYGLVRIFGEIFREPDASLILGISRGQFYSVITILIGAAVIYFARKSQRKQSSGT